MGSVLGIQKIEEPAFTVLSQRANYQIRKYGTRYVAKTSTDQSEPNQTPFSMLAKYIGVFGEAENENEVKLDMTAPVVMTSEKVAMTAPVVMQNQENSMTMMFVLPSQYDSMEKIPKPTNSRIQIERVSGAVGAVYRYSGSQGLTYARSKADLLTQELEKDGFKNYDIDSFQYWGFNPPFTLPFLRRNEVWIPLSEQEVQKRIKEWV